MKSPAREYALRTTSARVVSIDIRTVPSRADSTGSSLAHSVSRSTSAAPGRVDTAPRSTMSAPREIIAAMRDTASEAVTLLGAQNESGVRLTIPIILNIGL